MTRGCLLRWRVACCWPYLDRKRVTPAHGRCRCWGSDTPASCCARGRLLSRGRSGESQSQVARMDRRIQPPNLRALRHALSDERLDGYADPADSDPLEAIARYLWNMALGSALQPALHVFEGSAGEVSGHRASHRGIASAGSAMDRTCRSRHLRGGMENGCAWHSPCRPVRLDLTASKRV